MGTDSSTRLAEFFRFLPPSVFAEAAQRSGVRLGKSALGLPTLVILGLSAAFHQAKSFAEVLVLTVKLLENSEHWSDSPLAAPAGTRGVGKNGEARRNAPSTIREVAIRRS